MNQTIKTILNEASQFNQSSVEEINAWLKKNQSSISTYQLRSQILKNITLKPEDPKHKHLIEYILTRLKEDNTDNLTVFAHLEKIFAALLLDEIRAFYTSKSYQKNPSDFDAQDIIQQTLNKFIKLLYKEILLQFEMIRLNEIYTDSLRQIGALNFASSRTETLHQQSKCPIRTLSKLIIDKYTESETLDEFQEKSTNVLYVKTQANALEILQRGLNDEEKKFINGTIRLFDLEGNVIPSVGQFFTPTESECHHYTSLEKHLESWQKDLTDFLKHVETYQIAPVQKPTALQKLKAALNDYQKVLVNIESQERNQYKLRSNDKVAQRRNKIEELINFLEPKDKLDNEVKQKTHECMQTIKTLSPTWHERGLIFQILDCISLGIRPLYRLLTFKPPQAEQILDQKISEADKEVNLQR